MIADALDRVIATLSPRWGLERAAARATLAQIQSYGSATAGGYDAGKLNRLTAGRLGSQVKENAIPVNEVAYLRWQSWNLYRNNPWARKIVRSLQSKVVGRGMTPSCQVHREDGSPHTEFREAASELWEAVSCCFDFRGKPGSGGLSLVEIQRLALQSVILSGEVLAQWRPLSTRERDDRGSPIPLSMQLIDSDRLAAWATQYSNVGEGNGVYRGIELDSEGRRIAYHLQQYPLGYTSPLPSDIQRIEASRILHTYIEDDIDQYRGVPWFASALLQMRDTGDYQYNELKASAMAACVVLGYRKPSGSNKPFGVAQDSDVDTVDDNGNPITALQPGLIMNLGRDGEIQGFNPSRPGANAEAFINHLLRGTAAAFPGVKASTVTGDYRNSSFSSERAADNDCWPEIEALQCWFADHFMCPIWEQVIRAGIESGYFDGIVTAEQFAADPLTWLEVDWQGPIARSINPTDDAKSATMRVQGGLSSLQIECGQRNVDWRKVVKDAAELFQFGEDNGLPPEFINQLLGVDAQDVTGTDSEAGDGTPGSDPQDTEDDSAGEDAPMPAPAKKGSASAKQAVTAS